MGYPIKSEIFNGILSLNARGHFGLLPVLSVKFENRNTKGTKGALICKIIINKILSTIRFNNFLGFPWTSKCVECGPNPMAII